MYSPKIAEGFIPVLYRLAQDKKVSMTSLVNGWIKSGLEEEFNKGRDVLGGLTVYPVVRPAPAVLEEQKGYGNSAKPY